MKGYDPYLRKLKSKRKNLIPTFRGELSQYYIKIRLPFLSGICIFEGMDSTTELNLGPQPISQLMDQHGLTNHDVVAASPTPMTHKMVSRAIKGRKLTPHSQFKVLDAFNLAAKSEYTLQDLFNYGPQKRR